MPKISVMTMTAREYPNLDKMAQCLVNQTMTDFEWVIIDRNIKTRPNSQYEGIQKIVADKFPVRIIEPKWSIFHDYNMPALSTARNSGIMEADGELLVWVDDNIWFKSDFLKQHLKVYDLNTQDSKYYMIGLSWPFSDWDTVAEFSEVEPFNNGGTFCREGTSWEEHNDAVKCKDKAEYDDSRAYLSYPWPSGRQLLGEYEIVTGAWCYGRNMSMPLEASFGINGNDEDFDGVHEGEDMDYGMRLNNYGFKTLLNRKCCVYEYSGSDNKDMMDILPFMWGHIGVVNGVKATRGNFRNWAVVRNPDRYLANAWFNLREDKNRFREDVLRMTL